ncbi:prepilin peptidase [Amnibacterium endophyticum]|uniref:Prepilin peptidase n=1 Tax=Amnibacterium endophyticum TaxID=2109337 RepID=A0ABW4LCB2_9MICO
MSGLVVVMAAVLGLVVGSFLNVVAHRVPAGLSVVRPASRCPGCGNGIAKRDNVPVLSWLALRGACRHCRMPISARYPLIEAGTAVAFAVAVLPFAADLDRAVDVRTLLATTLEVVAFLYLAAISIALAAIDLDVKRLPNAIVLPAYAVGPALLGPVALLRGDLVPLGTAAAGAGAAFLLYFTLWFFKPGGMGLGDVKLAGVLGLFLGFLGVPQLVVGVAAGFLLGGVFGALLLVTRRSSRSSAIPFGPWMLLGAWVGVLAGQPVAAGYLRLVGLS